MMCGSCDLRGPVHLSTGRYVYPHRLDLWDLPFWKCDNCGAHVGCHPGTTRALGLPANAETRAARRLAHAVFDAIWSKKKILSREEAYAWLSHEMSIHPIHIGELNVEQCARVTALCRERIGAS
jgi:hypothetical protein